MDEESRIEAFLAGAPHAVVGASRDKSKIGYRVLRAYQQKGRPAWPVNPYAKEIAGLTAYPDLASLPERVHGVSVITPPDLAETIVDHAADAGVQHVWFQPGAESPEAVERAEELGINVISGGACLLVVLGYRGD